MLSVVLVGSGNVSHHLFKALGKHIIQVFGRNADALKAFSNETDTTTSYEKIKKADLYLLAVNDDSISSVSRRFSEMGGLIAHTSGSVAISEIQAERKGVFYPLQTFTKDKKVDFSEVPICLEADLKEDYELLSTLANSISKSVHSVSSDNRKKLHLAAVFANNFSNHLFQISREICEQGDLEFVLLRPLINETVNKIYSLDPLTAQTGPAKRNDIEAMQGHIDSLENKTHKKIYQVISESIRKTYEEKL